jgi:Phosphoenolpyruvate synthase/pyruvate phosphate dikinase
MFYRCNEVIGEKDLGPLIGKKALSLFEMTQWGFPVPTWGCITTRGFDEFVLLNKIGHYIKTLKDGLQHDAKGIMELAYEIQQLILQGDVPAALKLKIMQFTSERPGMYFAVRSSGTKEDMSEASFAGQYTTILNVQASDRLILAVKQCWASLFNDRVLNYCINKGIAFSDMKLAVIIQEMIPSEKSGVAFTVNPIKGFDKEILIEACFGVGEVLVGGEVNPDQYIYNWDKAQETLRELGDKKISLVAVGKPPYLEKIKNTETQRRSAVLSPEEVRELAELCLEIQAKYGFPVDIEWAQQGGRFFIVQSRPITTINYSGIENEWTTADFRDGGVSSTVCSPFMWSLYDLILEDAMSQHHLEAKLFDSVDGITWGDMFYGRPYWNLTAVKRGLEGLPGFIERDFDNSLGIKITYEGPGMVSKTTPRTILKAIQVLSALSKLFAYGPKHWPTFKSQQEEKLHQLDTANPNALLREEFFRFYERFIKEEYVLSETTYFRCVLAISNLSSLFKESFDKLSSPINYLTLLSGLTDLSHLIPNYRLWDIRNIIRADSDALAFWKATPVPDLKEVWRTDKTEYHMDKVRDYIRDFKFHSTRELDLTVPRYDEDPSAVMKDLKNLLDLEDTFEPRVLNQKQHAAFEQERTKFKAFLPFYKRRSMDKKLQNLRRYLWWREELRDLSTHYYYHIRRCTLVLERHFADLGIVDELGDIFFLPVTDIFDIMHGTISRDEARKLLAKNKLYYRSFRNYTNPNEIGSRFDRTVTTTLTSGKALKGISCSPGVISGRARVIKDIFDAERLTKGDILITKFTDPGWTPKFSLISAVATETGGLLSHAAVISREYGIPAVLAIPDLTNMVKDGQLVTVDGNTGRVFLQD